MGERVGVLLGHAKRSPHRGLVNCDLLARKQAHLRGEHVAVAAGHRGKQVHHLGHDVQVGGQGGDGSVEEHQVLDVQHEDLRQPGTHAQQRLGDPLQLRHHLFLRHLGGVEHLAVKAQLLDHPVEVDVIGQRAQVAERPELTLDVAGGAGDHQAEERHALLLGHPGGDAEVEQRDAPVGEHEQVAAVQVAVEDAVHHGALGKADHAGADHVAAADAGGDHALDVLPAVALKAFHHQHPTGDEGRMGPGDDEAPLVEVGEHLGHVQHVLGLKTKVEFLGDRLGEQLDQSWGVGQRRHGDPADEERRQPGHDLEVAVHRGADGGPLHLDDHLLTGEQGGHVHLGDRRRSQRGALEAGEHLLERAAQVGLDHLAHDVEVFGGHLVAQQGELGDEFVGEDAGPRGDDLPELDVGGAEILRGLAQTPGQPFHPWPAVLGTAFVNHPAGQRPDDAAAHRDEPPERGDAFGRGEAGHLAGERGADDAEADVPVELVPVDHPWSGLGEGVAGQLGGEGLVAVMGRHIGVLGRVGGADHDP